MSQTADVLIIGGGVQGASLAFQLTLRGVKVVVLEKHHVGGECGFTRTGFIEIGGPWPVDPGELSEHLEIDGDNP